MEQGETQARPRHQSHGHDNCGDSERPFPYGSIGVAPAPPEVAQDDCGERPVDDEDEEIERVDAHDADRLEEPRQTEECVGGVAARSDSGGEPVADCNL